jgi:hypothetical protein
VRGTKRCLLYRFFHVRADFEEEVALYRDPVLKKVLPELLAVTDNADGGVTSRSGYAYPPFFVLERGQTLAEWVKSPRNFFEITTLVERLAQLLHELHGSGRVHRDLKVRSGLIRSHAHPLAHSALSALLRGMDCAVRDAAVL